MREPLLQKITEFNAKGPAMIRRIEDAKLIQIERRRARIYETIWFALGMLVGTWAAK